MAQDNKKIKKYRKPINLNIGMIIFGVVFVYVVICVIMYFQTGRIVRYEVKEGSLTTEKTYRGVIIREETVVYADVAGYVNYYAREGERVAKNDLVYVMDETGRLNEEMDTVSLGENSLSNRELSEFRNEIVNFVHGFHETSYESTYDFKNSLKNTVLKLANVNMLENAGNLNSGSGANSISYFYAPKTGITAYWTDGYETLTPENVTASVFDEKNYEKNQVLSNTLKAAGDPIYKLSNNENWSLVIPVEAARGAALEEEGYILVRFLKNRYESWGATKLFTGSDGSTYLQLSFNNSMVTFMNDRFLDVELLVEDDTGLKIPVSSIVEKEFFLVPETFVQEGTNNGISSVLRQQYLENGELSSSYVEVSVYHFNKDTKEYYLDTAALNPGDILIKSDGQETYTVSKRGTLIGVYNMNKGYADFKQINILYQNDEYAIVNSNTKYGLNVYDYIVLDAASVNEDQFINE